jgi:hypothetical protein
LGGCRIVFSRVFPVGEANPHLHPLWQTAEQFGAVCTNQIDEQVTHVVANSLGTDKVLLLISLLCRPLGASHHLDCSNRKPWGSA